MHSADGTHFKCEQAADLEACQGWRHAHPLRPKQRRLLQRPVHLRGDLRVDGLLSRHLHSRQLRSPQRPYGNRAGACLDASAAVPRASHLLG